MAEPQKTGQTFDADRFAEAVAKAVADATVQVQERTNPIERRTPSLVSPLNPEGLKVRPKLARRYIFCNAELEEAQMTNEEIRLVNQITTPGEYRNGQWKVRVKTDGSGLDTIWIDLPVKELDQRMALPPSLVAIIQEILDANKARALA